MSRTWKYGLGKGFAVDRSHVLLDHLALAAFRAAARSFFLPSFFARAGPPFNPPLRPSATAAGSFSRPSFGARPTGFPLAISVIAAASWLMSSVFRFASWSGHAGHAP